MRRKRIIKTGFPLRRAAESLFYCGCAEKEGGMKAVNGLTTSTKPHDMAIELRVKIGYCYGVYRDHTWCQKQNSRKEPTDGDERTN